MTSPTIAVIGLFFLAMGTYALISPGALVAPFRLSARSPESRSEIRAVYGGFGIAMAAGLIPSLCVGVSAISLPLVIFCRSTLNALSLP